MSLDQSTVVQVLLRERLRISASALSILRDVHAADDIFQQVVLQALQGQEHFREPEHVLAWALRAARHRAIDMASKRGAKYLDVAVLELLEEQWTTAPTNAVTSRVEALQRCLEKLPQPARRLLQLRYDEGLSCTAVAKQLRRTLDAVYQSLSRVHRQLRHCVESQIRSADQPLGEALS